MAKDESAAAASSGERKDQAQADELGPAVAAELPFSEMISRWLDDGDRLHESGPSAGESGGEVGAHPGRWQGFVDEARSRAHRHRRVVVGAALLGVILLVVAFRHSIRSTATADAGEPAPPVVVAALSPVVAPAPVAPAAAAPPRETETVTAAAPPVVAAPAPTATVAEQPVANADPPPAAPPNGTLAQEPSAAPANTEPAAAAAPPPAPAPAAVNPVDKEARTLTGSESPQAAVAVALADPQRVTAAPGEQARPAAATREKPAGDEPGAPAAPADSAKPRRPETTARAAESPASAAHPLEGCKSALQRQRARDALANCRQVFASDPRSADAMVLLARADLLAGRPTETLQLAHRAVNTNPRHADAYLLIGTVQQVEGRRIEARSAYETYLQLAPLGAHASDVKAILRTL